MMDGIVISKAYIFCAHKSFNAHISNVSFEKHNFPTQNIVTSDQQKEEHVQEKSKVKLFSMPFSVPQNSFRG